MESVVDSDREDFPFSVGGVGRGWKLMLRPVSFVFIPMRRSVWEAAKIKTDFSENVYPVDRLSKH